MFATILGDRDVVPTISRIFGVQERLNLWTAHCRIGIDSFEQTLIFDKFYRGGRERYTSPGAGMGLPIAKVIVAAHGGSLAVVNQLGSGSVFSVTIPIYVDPGASRPTPVGAGQSNRSDSPTQRP